MPVESRQYAQVFRAASRLLRPDHVGEVSDDDFHLSYAQAVRVDHKLGVAAGEAGRMEGDVEFTVRADQIPHLGRCQGRGIVAEGQPAGFPLGPDPRAKLL